MSENNERNDELYKEWVDGYQVFMNKARNSETVEEEFIKQQNVYNKYSNIYDKAIILEKYSGATRIADQVNTLFTDKLVKILDYGCGTGKVGEYLMRYQFTNVDGIDASEEMLSVARSKNIMKNLICGRNTDGFKNIESKQYDAVVSAGTFFLTWSHPGTECFSEICRVIKNGGYFVFLTKNSYLSHSYVDWSIVDKLLENNLMQLISKENFDGYRATFEHENFSKSVGVIYTFKIL